MQRINIENWTYCRYQKDKFLALITFGASPESMRDDRMEYYVTVLENEDTEAFQMNFYSLPEACFYINDHYHDWQFQDQTAATKSGCSTCAAH